MKVVNSLMDKPQFEKEQMVSATDISKHFSKIGKQAKKNPIAILDNNDIDTILIGYKEYEKLIVEQNKLNELLIDLEAYNRLEQDKNVGSKKYSLKEVMGDDYESFCKINPEVISDEDLFE